MAIADYGVDKCGRGVMSKYFGTCIGLFVLFMSSSFVCSECLEYKITDYGDHVEAVCVGGDASINESISGKPKKVNEVELTYEQEKLLTKISELESSLINVRNIKNKEWLRLVKLSNVNYRFIEAKNNEAFYLISFEINRLFVAANG